MAACEHWRQRLGLVTPDLDLPIFPLKSGGNQAKGAIRQSIGAHPAPIILMTTPCVAWTLATSTMSMPRLPRRARRGRTFIWYTTEFDELFHCDRTYVFNSGEVVGELMRPN